MHRAAFVIALVAPLFFACSGDGDGDPKASTTAGAGGATSSTGAGGALGSSTTTTGSAATGGGGAGGASSDLPGWHLVWSDEFEGPNGADVDPTKWVHVESGNGNGNAERQYYTPGTANAFLGGGALHIVAEELPADGGGFDCWYGPCRYTSGKIVTKAWGEPSLFEKQFGRFSARMKIPAGQGVWPAFWMLGNDIEQVDWPSCGEIDVMENIGKEPATLYGTVHGPDANQNNVAEGGKTTLSAGALADDFHVYTVEWKPGEVRFLLDDVPYFTSTQASFQGKWVFDDHPYYLLLNLAIGGSWPGDPDGATTFPAEMLVDWVRVYDAVE